MDWDEYIVKVSELVEARENYQKTLGEIAFTVTNEFGNDALDGLAEELKENYGYKISPATLRNYRWVWGRTKDLELPEDVPYRLYQTIAGTDDPKAWANKLKEGFSCSEVIKQIRDSKGLGKKEKTFLCKFCGAENKI